MPVEEKLTVEATLRPFGSTSQVLGAPEEEGDDALFFVDTGGVPRNQAIDVSAWSSHVLNATG